MPAACSPIQRELDRLKGEHGEVKRRLEAATDVLGQIENLEGLKVQMFFRYMYEGPERMESWSPEDRQRLYQDLGLAAYFGPDGLQEFRWTFSGTANTSSPSGTTNMSKCRTTQPWTYRDLRIVLAATVIPHGGSGPTRKSLIASTVVFGAE
jgi:hypothetical protein